jgi:hypothetical protein
MLPTGRTRMALLAAGSLRTRRTEYTVISAAIEVCDTSNMVVSHLWSVELVLYPPAELVAPSF